MQKLARDLGMGDVFLADNRAFVIEGLHVYTKEAFEGDFGPFEDLSDAEMRYPLVYVQTFGYMDLDEWYFPHDRIMEVVYEQSN